MYNLFISHSWSYSDAYDKLIDKLNDYPYFKFKDYSVPFDDPLNTTGTDANLSDAIYQQMKPASCVLVLAGVYSSYSKWIQKEIRMAKRGYETPKKVIAIEPWGSERTSVYVKENADYIVKWNAKSIVNAIRD